MDLRDLLKSILFGCIDGLRRNRLPAILSAIALVLTTALAVTSNFDERPHYRKTILPEIRRAEQPFFAVMEEASRESDDLRRLLYFLEAHRRAKAALRVVQSEHPMTEAGRQAQGELVRYYELVDEQLAIIRTEMSFNESYDYIAAWRTRDAELTPIRNRWLVWLQSN